MGGRFFQSFQYFGDKLPTVFTLWILLFQNNANNQRPQGGYFPRQVVN